MRFYFSEVDVELDLKEFLFAVIGGISVVGVPLLFKFLMSLI